MLIPRIMPCLLLQDGRLVKTVRFHRPQYVGDPVNAIKIYNEKEVDELVCLDISATPEGRGPNLDIIASIASECFMPLAYGGGITSVEDMRKVFSIGVEKVIINSAALANPDLIAAAARAFGSQSIVVSMDVKKNMLGRYVVMSHSGRRKTTLSPEQWAREAQRRGAGELLVTSIDREGTWKGYDLDLVKSISEVVSVPVVASGGAGKVDDFVSAIKAGASACAAGSMTVYQGPELGVLINFPARERLESALASR